MFELDGGVTYLENEPLDNVHRVPLYHERYVFMCGSTHKLAKQSRLSWAQAVQQPLCLLSDDMQNRRILNDIAGSIGLKIEAPVVSNSFLAVCSHLRSGAWCSIVPHTFLYVFGNHRDIKAIELINPVQNLHFQRKPGRMIAWFNQYMQ